MSNWIENFKRIYKATKSVSDKVYMITALEDKCYEKGYTVDETKAVVNYVKA